MHKRRARYARGSPDRSSKLRGESHMSCSDLRVLLWSPLRGLDPPSGDVSYTEALLEEPPPGVVYTTYRQAIEDGTVRVRGRKPWRGGLSGTDLGLFAARSVEQLARRSGVLFRERVGYVTVEAGAYDLIHQHLAALRQVGSHVPVVSSAGYPLTELYRWREGWGALHLRAATGVEAWMARAVDAHNPWLRAGRDGVLTVYGDHFRTWLLDRGVDGERVLVSATALPDLRLPPRRSDGRTLAVVARDFWRKGGDVAVEAFRRLHRRDPAWRLVVVTTAASAAAHQSLLDHPAITLELDAARDAILHRVLPTADILLLPTRSDCGAPYGVLEALQAGVSVVISDLPWLDDRLQPPAVARVPRCRPDCVVTAVLRFAEQADRATAAHKLWREQFSMPVLHSQLRCAYDAALWRARPSGHRADPPPLEVGTEGRRGRLTVAGRPADFSGIVHDGFVTRHSRMLRSLASVYDLSVLGVASTGEPAATVTLPAGVPYTVVACPAPAQSRVGRVLAAARQFAGYESDNEREMVAAASRLAPDVVVTVGPWLASEYRPLWRRYPSVHLFEEDLTRMAEIAPQSARARAMRLLIDQLHAWAPGQPMTVVAISPAEQRRAEVRFPRAAHACLPFTLDPEEWPDAPDRTTSGALADRWVVVVGNYAEDRNAEGLAAVLDAAVAVDAKDTLRFDVVSGPGLHPLLQSARSGLEVRHRRLDGPVRAAYDTAWAALVPARRVTGQKTTILQAWACRVPVVCSVEAAATLAASPAACAAGATPNEMVDHLLALRGDATQREALVESGAAELAQRFDPKQEEPTVRRLLEAAAMRWRSRSRVADRR